MGNKELSPQEFFIGLAATIFSVIFIKWWGILAAVLCGVLWVLGGTYWKPIRRFGVPSLMWVAVETYRGWPPIDLWPVLAFGLGVAILHIGDGFPDHRPTTEDEGSDLGRWVEEHITADDRIGGPLTKWLIALIFQLSLIPYLVRL